LRQQFGITDDSVNGTGQLARVINALASNTWRGPEGAFAAVLTLAAKYLETGSVSATWPRCTISDSSSEVNTFVTELISKTVSPFRARGFPFSRAP